MSTAGAAASVVAVAGGGGGGGRRWAAGGGGRRAALVGRELANGMVVVDAVAHTCSLCSAVFVLTSLTAIFGCWGWCECGGSGRWAVIAGRRFANVN